jgi:hypothetical protein
MTLLQRRHMIASSESPASVTGSLESCARVSCVVVSNRVFGSAWSLPDCATSTAHHL